MAAQCSQLNMQYNQDVVWPDLCGSGSGVFFSLGWFGINSELCNWSHDLNGYAKKMFSDAISFTRAGVLYFGHFLRRSTRTPTLKAVRGTVAIKGIFDN